MLKAKGCSALVNNILRPNKLLLLLRAIIFHIVQAYAMKKETQTYDHSALSR